MDPFERSTGHLVDRSKVARCRFLFQCRKFLVPTVNLLPVVLIPYLISGEIWGLFVWSVPLIVFFPGIAFARWLYRTFRVPGMNGPDPDLFEVDTALPEYRRIALLWRRKCDERGLRSAGIYFCREDPTNFGILVWRCEQFVALRIPHRDFLERFIDIEIEAILEHELGHKRLTRQYLRFVLPEFCLPAKLTFIKLRAQRTALLDRGRLRAAAIVHRLECAAYLLTYESVAQEEEHIADALSAEALGAPYPLISALAIFRENETRVDDDMAFLLAALEKFDPLRSISDTYNAKFSTHPTDPKRIKRLLELRA